MKKLLAALLLSAIPSLALAPSSFGQGAPDPAAGKKLWESNELFCKNCHGRDGEGAFGPDLAGRGLSPAQFLKAVRKPWGVMPAFTDAQLSDAEAASLAAYFGTLQKVAEPAQWRVPVSAASASHGQQIYIANGCAQCHGATFDMPRATFGGRAATYDDLRQLVYTHTDFMPKYEEQRPGSRLRMGNFDPLRLSEAQLHEIYTWAHDEIGFRPQLAAQYTATGTSFTLNVSNNGETGKGLTAQGVVIDVLVPAGATVTATAGAGYKGVHMDDKLKGNVAEWQVAKLAPKDTQTFTISFSQAAANPADMKGAIRWAKPAPKSGPNGDALNFALRPAGGPGGGGAGANRTAQ